MDWIQFVIFVGGIVGLFFWNRSEHREDIRHMDMKIDAMRNLIHEIHEDNRTVINAIREEIKDFHGRLCALESKKNNNKEK